MPSFDQALDAALLAFGRGSGLARAETEALARDFPERPEGQALGALWKLSVGDRAGADAMDLGDSAAAWAVRASILLSAGEIEASDEKIEAALAAAPNDPVVLRVAPGLVGREDPERGLALARRAVEHRPHDSLDYQPLIAALLALGRTDELEELAESPPAPFAESLSYLLLQATLASRRGDTAAAERSVRQAVALAPDLVTPWVRLAVVLREQGQIDGAEEAARHALEINPVALGALSILAMAAERRGDKREADRLRELRRKENPLVETLKPMEDVRKLFQAGKHEELLQALERFDRLPKIAQPGAFSYRIRMLTLLGDNETLRRAVEAYGQDDAVSAIGRAELLLRAKRFEEARALLEPWWERDHPAVVAAFLVRARSGCDEKAARELAEALIESPPGNVLDAFKTLLAIARAGFLKKESARYLTAVERRFPSSQVFKEFRTGVLMRMGRFHEAWTLGETLEGSHRERFRGKWRKFAGKAVLRILWRRLRGPKPKGKPPVK